MTMGATISGYGRVESDGTVDSLLTTQSAKQCALFAGARALLKRPRWRWWILLLALLRAACYTGYVTVKRGACGFDYM